ncbi:MAG: hypothetical protein LUD27_02915, partial [Clostridia bacterium]|nr:hypothetical protein [Clostridia bacterium]
MGEPIILNKPDTGKYAKLRSTENLSDYISCLKEFKQDIAILVAAKRGIGQFVNNIIADKWKELGFTAELLQNKSSSYIAVMKNGTVTFEKNENGKDCNYSEDNYNITSTFSGNAEFIKIAIGELNYAINCDGLNFVVVDTVTGNIEDTVCFETGKNNMPCCRLSPDLAVQCSEATNEEKYGFIVEKLRKELNLIPDKRVVVRYFNNLGDFYSLCATTEYTEKELNIELILLSIYDRESDIAGFFSHNNFKIKLYKLTRYENEIVTPIYTNSKHNNIFYKWDNKKIGTYTKNLGDDFYKAVKKPIFDPIDEQNYIRKFGIIPGKTVFVIPFSNAIEPIPVYFWNFCAELFKMIGLSVIFNVPKDKERLFCAKSVYVPIKDSIGFADLCGYVFGMRCGFFDVISSSSAQMTIFSTKFFAPLDKVFNIKNDDNRIRTIFIDKGDYDYKKTMPFNIISALFDTFNIGMKENIKNIIRYVPSYYNLSLKPQ